MLRHLVQPGHSEHLAQRAHLECWNHWRHQALEFREPKAQPGSTELREQLAHRVNQVHSVLLKSYLPELLELLERMAHRVRRPVDLELEARHLPQLGQPALLVLMAHSEH